MSNRSSTRGAAGGGPADEEHTSSGERGRVAPPGSPVENAPAAVALNMTALMARFPARCEAAPCKGAIPATFGRRIYKLVSGEEERDAAVDELGGALATFSTKPASAARFSMLGDQTLELELESSSKGAIEAVQAAARALGWFIPKKSVLFSETREQREFPHAINFYDTKRGVAQRNAEWRRAAIMAEFVGTRNTVAGHGPLTVRDPSAGMVPVVGKLTAGSAMYGATKALMLRGRGTVNTPSLRAEVADRIAGAFYSPADILKYLSRKSGLTEREVAQRVKGPRIASILGTLHAHIYGPLPPGWTEARRVALARAELDRAVVGINIPYIADTLIEQVMKYSRVERIPAARGDWGPEEPGAGPPGKGAGLRGGARRKTRRRRQQSRRNK